MFAKVNRITEFYFLFYSMTSNPMKKTPLILACAALVPMMASAGPISRHIASPAKAPIRDSKAPVDCKAPICDPCLSYDFIDLDYGITDFSNGFLNDDATSIGISFSKSLGEVLFLTGGYTNTDADYIFGGIGELEEHRYQLGLGARYSLATCVDFTFEGGIDHRDISANGNGISSFDSWGYYVGPGIRARSGNLEGYAKIFYVDREGVPNAFVDTDGWVFKPGVLWHLTDNLALKVAADFGDNYSTVTFGARIHF